jgi:hypothetical protein
VSSRESNRSGATVGRGTDVVVVSSVGEGAFAAGDDVVLVVDVDVVLDEQPAVTPMRTAIAAVVKPSSMSL